MGFFVALGQAGLNSEFALWSPVSDKEAYNTIAWVGLWIDAGSRYMRMRRTRHRPSPGAHGLQGALKEVPVRP
ncbi:hypothetical protein APTSU1_000466500 [Apodemus speciosus]|uniref:Uncharacterized protein n=1 Tax=Apodemus speciosus TaxID=105296 RepID=A0ABQ0EQX4_APOSI